MTVNLGVTVGSPLLPNSVNRGRSVNLRVGFLICTVEAIPIPLGGAGEGGAVPRGLYEEHFSVQHIQDQGPSTPWLSSH